MSRKKKDKDRPKMTAAEAGRLGGLVEGPKPSDFIVGNPDARKLAQKCGTKSDLTMRESVEMYQHCPDVVIRLGEIFLEVINQRGSMVPVTRRYQKAAHQCVQELASIQWENIDMAHTSFRPYYMQLEIGVTARVMFRIWEKENLS